MGLVNGKCPNCGGILQTDPSHDAAVCPYCDTPFIVEKAINEYNIVNHNTIHAQTVNIYQQGDVAESKEENRFIISDPEIYKDELSDLDRAMGRRCARMTVRGTQKSADGIMLSGVLGEYVITELVFEEGVVWITGRWGWGKTLKYLSLPKSLMQIESEAFANNTALEKVLCFPELLEKPGYSDDAFSGTPFEGSMKSAKGRAEYEARQRKISEESARKAQQEAWRAAGRCWKCGGRLKKDKLLKEYYRCVKCGQSMRRN